MNPKLNTIDLLTENTKPTSFDSDDKHFVFVIFHNQASVEVSNLLLDAPTGSVILRFPNIQLDIRPLGNYSLSYSLLTFSGADASKVVSLSNIEPNILLQPLQVHYTDSIFNKINLESSEKALNWKSITLGLILELLSKTFRLSNHDFTESLPDHPQKLRDLRSEIHENFAKPWKIDDMAVKMNLSTSRFASLYKSTFKISPTEDLIQTRIDQAKKMLSSSKVSVKKVSEACGFESVHYFHRAFKKRANLTPKHFQNSQFAQGGSVYTPQRHFSLDRLTQLAEYSGIIEMMDGELRFHGNTQHVSEFLGYSLAELRDNPFLNFVAPEDYPIANDAVSKIRKDKNILDLNIKLLHQNGQKIPVQFSALLKGKNWYWFIKHSAVAV
ncbi:MAG: AraC family transcriptional regulator [Opitutae bacterium]